MISHGVSPTEIFQDFYIFSHNVTCSVIEVQRIEFSWSLQDIRPLKIDSAIVGQTALQEEEMDNICLSCPACHGQYPICPEMDNISMSCPACQTFMVWQILKLIYCYLTRAKVHYQICGYCRHYGLKICPSRCRNFLLSLLPDYP